MYEVMNFEIAVAITDWDPVLTVDSFRKISLCLVAEDGIVNFFLVS